MGGAEATDLPLLWHQQILEAFAMLSLSSVACSYVPPAQIVSRSRPIVLSEFANPTGQGFKPLVVPNQALPGQTSGLSW